LIDHDTVSCASKSPPADLISEAARLFLELTKRRRRFGERAARPGRVFAVPAAISPTAGTQAGHGFFKPLLRLSFFRCAQALSRQPAASAVAIGFSGVLEISSRVE